MPAGIPSNRTNTPPIMYGKIPFQKQYLWLLPRFEVLLKSKQKNRERPINLNQIFHKQTPINYSLKHFRALWVMGLYGFLIHN
ncbi:hypothetical protein CSE16_15415 [Solibacillus sp. R5-41]|nr:hypothetical protein CSE16_15415 [Solibacillus sp. R5-41]